MEIAYFAIYVLLLCFYIFYYWKLSHGLLKVLKTKDEKEFDKFISLHSLLFLISTVIIQLYNYVFFFLFINKYGGDWNYIIPLGVLCIVLLIAFTITVFNQKRAILNKYEEQNGVEYNFYKQLEYISLFRFTCIIISTILIINTLATVL